MTRISTIAASIRALTEEGPLKVVDMRVTIVGTPWRELVFLELKTDTGLIGVGEVRMVNKTGTLVACIGELAPRYVMGSDPFDVERLAWHVRRAEYGRPGEVTQPALAVFDVACWPVTRTGGGASASMVSPSAIRSYDILD